MRASASSSSAEACFLLRFHRRDRVLEVGDLRHQGAGARVVLRLLRLADLLRGGVAARLHLLELRDRRAAPLVARDQARGLGREAAARKAAIEGFRIVANPPDVVHDDVFSPVTGLRPAIPIRPERVAPSRGSTGVTPDTTMR